MKRYYAYIRVSTKKQDEGVSLPEQKAAITRYAEARNLEIIEWFEEKKTAAKRGRPLFNQLMKLLKLRKADGVIIHKIDRSARNLSDWAAFGELIDSGVDVHFANESLDLDTRGGRLSADIQAVIAADFIRNLKDELRKGFYGRLKQGLYPLPAPIGYCDNGKGKPKTFHPTKAPQVRRAFELYATGRYNLHSLVVELKRMGLRNRHGGPVSINGASRLLNNPFYIGLIKIKSGEIFEGIHQPLIKKTLFDRVQAVLQGKLNPRSQKHGFAYRRLLKCKFCGLSLIGERQKGNIYYRCHTRGCATKGVREETVEQTVGNALSPFAFNAVEIQYIRQKVGKMRAEWTNRKAEEIVALKLQLGGVKDRLGRLTDAFLDQALDKELFNERKAIILSERLDLENRLADLGRDSGQGMDRLTEFLELAGTLQIKLKHALSEEKRELLQIATSNRFIEGKNLAVELQLPFQVVAEGLETYDCEASRDIPRTWDKIIHELLKIAHSLPTLASQSIS